MRTLLWFLIPLLGLASCDLINPEEEVPAYLYIDEFTLGPNPNINHGSLSSRITNAYVFVGGDVLGLVSLPALLPVTLTGEQEVIIDPMIRDNGVAATVNLYPFYQRFSVTIDLQPTQIDTIHPATRYRDDAKFAFIEDFEFTGNIFDDDRDGNDATFVDTTTVEVFEGNGSGRIHLTKDDPFIEVATDLDQLFDLNDAGRAYLEVNYKTDIDVIFGYIGHNISGSPIPEFVFGVNPKDSWNKIYFNLTDIILTTNFDKGYQIVITAGLPIAGGEIAVEEGDIYLDNIKLVYF